MSNFRQGLTLSQRIGYLARAVMCMRSDKVGSAPHLGVFLQELEDKMEVAAIQQKVQTKKKCQVWDSNPGFRENGA